MNKHVKYSSRCGCSSELLTSWALVLSMCFAAGINIKAHDARRTLDLLINFAERAKNPSLGTARIVLNILQDHYPERLGLAVIVNVPFLVHAFFKVISAFIDPVTKEKMKFNPEVIKDGIFTVDQAMSQWWGGNQDFEYEHEKYWPALVEMCEERSKAWLEKWRALGGTIGIKEWDYKQEGKPVEKIEVVANGTVDKGSDEPAS